MFVFPTNDARTLVATGWPHSEFERVRRDIDTASLATLGAIPALRERLAGASRTERYYGMADLPNFFCQPCGPGWVLVGDAGHHTDPLSARGISNALADAERAAEAIADGLTGNETIEAALAGYWRERDARAIPDHELNMAEAQLEHVAPAALALRAALRNDPEEAGRFYAARFGVTPLHEYMAPEHLRSVVARATAVAAR
ncbi:MAG: hypothetical protein FJ035_01335 [Chloroflexi bacterium]|nr:hypothetical protein [Chloroflexota bacterium]